MSYFATSNHTTAPELAPPVGLQLWPDSEGYLLTWRRALSRVEGYIVFQGTNPSTLAVVGRVNATTLRWQVELAAGPLLAVACVCGTTIGPISGCVAIDTLPRQPEQDAGQPQVSQGPVAESEATTNYTPYGSCHCCHPPQPLVPETGMLACTQSGEQHLLLPSGLTMRVAELPFGLCVCCEPAQPLMRAGGEVVCSRQTERAYSWQGGAWRPVAQRAQHALADANAIDAALRANSALLGANGVFISED